MSKKKSRPAGGSKALAVRRPEPPVDMSNPALAFAQLARDKTIDADRLEKLIHLQERIMDRNALMAFNAAYTAMSDQLPVIKKNGRIHAKDGSLRSRYSKLEDIQSVVKPVLKQHGFAIRHRTEWPGNGIIRIVGILSHLEGHSESSSFEAPPDKNDYRTNIQDQGSTVSYGRRYTIIDLLNIEQEGVDNDGQGAQTTRHPRREAAPAGSNSSSGAVISDGQRRRLWTIAQHAGRTQDELKAWLAVAYDLDSTKKILRKDYDAICQAVEGSGPLPAPREPGSDDE